MLGEERAGKALLFQRFRRLQKPQEVVEWTLARSTRAAKKWMVTVIRTTSSRPVVIHFGDSAMQDYTQLLEHAPTEDKERRRRFHQRFASLIAATRTDPLNARLLW